MTCDQIKDDEMAGACSTHGNWSENLKGKDHSEDLGVDGKIILQWNLGKQG